MYKTFYIDTQIDIYSCKRSCYIFITHIILSFTISHLFFLQLWLNNKADWTLLPYSSNQFRRRKSVFKTSLKEMGSVILSCSRYTTAAVAAVYLVPL